MLFEVKDLGLVLRAQLNRPALVPASLGAVCPARLGASPTSAFLQLCETPSAHTCPGSAAAVPGSTYGASVTHPQILSLKLPLPALQEGLGVQPGAAAAAVEQ